MDCLSILASMVYSSVQFSRSVVSESWWHHELQHSRPPCPSPTPAVYTNFNQLIGHWLCPPSNLLYNSTWPWRATWWNSRPTWSYNIHPLPLDTYTTITSTEKIYDKHMAKITNACLKSANQMVKCDLLWQVHGLLHVVQRKHGSKRNQYGHCHQQN